MKIALSLSGLPRLHLISVASWSRIIGKYQPDIYIHTWQDGQGSSSELLHLINWIFKPTAVKIDPLPTIDTSIYPDRHWPYTDVYRSLSMWHGINRSYEMVKGSKKDYDLVIRGRMDWHVHSLDILEFDGIVLPFDYDKLPLKFVYRGNDMHGFNDHFAYGPVHQMDKYVNTLNEIPRLYLDEQVDYCPENFLAASLFKQNVSVKFQRMEHCLVRM